MKSCEMQQERTKAIDDVKEIGEMKVAEYEQRLERLRAEYESRIESMQSRFKHNFERERARIDAVMSENEELRRMLAERKAADASSANSLHSELEKSISKLQQQTSEFKDDLSRSWS